MKSRRFFDFLTLCLLTALVVFGNFVRADEPPLCVAVTPDSLRFAWSPSAGTTEIQELPLHTSAVGEGHVLWSGEGSGATVPRFDGKRDRLFAKFERRAGGKALGSPQHVTDFSALPQRKNSLGSLGNKKGIACLLDVEDGKALGFGQSNQNINIGWLIDWQSVEPKLSFEFEGRKIGLRPAAVAALDRELQALHAADTPKVVTNRPVVGVIRWDAYMGGPHVTQQQEMGLRKPRTVVVSQDRRSRAFARFQFKLRQANHPRDHGPGERVGECSFEIALCRRCFFEVSTRFLEDRDRVDIDLSTRLHGRSASDSWRNFTSA